MIWRWAFIRLVLVCGCSWVGALAAPGGPKYDLNRRIEPMDPFGNGAATAQNLYERAIRLSGIVPGETEVAMVSNRLVEREGAALGFATESAAWSNAWLSARTTYYAHPWVDNAGWISKTTTDKDGAWSAYAYHLQNELWFRPATSVWYSPAAGVTARIARVLVGSLGDWCLPLIGEQVPFAHHLGPTWTNGPRGYLKNESVSLQPDLRTYYKILPELFWPINDGDGDGDGIPGLADGFNLDGIPGNADDQSTGDNLLPWRITIPDHLDPACVTIQLDYLASPPHEAATWLSNQTIRGLRVWGIHEDGSRTYFHPGKHHATNLGLSKKNKSINLYIESASVLHNIPVTYQIIPAPSCSCNVFNIEKTIYDGLIVSSVAIKLSVDLNRDFKIKFEKVDATEIKRPYYFWLNNDRDYGDDDKADDLDPSKGHSDCYDDEIACLRDLEDFSPLGVCISADNEFIKKLELDEYSIYLSIINSTSSPSLKLYTSASKSGHFSYLYNTNTSWVQSKKSPFNKSLGEATKLSDVKINFERLQGDVASKTNLNREFYYIFEACSAGSGELVLILKKNNNAVYKSAPVTINFKDIKMMYEHYTVGDTDVMDVSAIPTNVAEVNGFSYNSSRGDAQDYILFVHGWRMLPWERRAFAETAYKRLFWENYRGLFGFFSWPTEHCDPVWKDPFNYDRSEEKAWRSGAGLHNLLVMLNGLYPDKVRIFAHSMGNVVTSEAIRNEKGKGSPQKIVHTYVASQAASVAHAYDRFGPHSIESDKSTKTPETYATYPPTGEPYFCGISSIAAGSIVNFCNRFDYALKKWELNQDKKPDYLYNYEYIRFDYSEKRYLYDPDGPDYTILNFPKDAFKIYSYIAEARSLALGAEINTGGEISGVINLNGKPFHYGNGSHEHSAQFRSIMPRRHSYWRTLLDEFEILSP